MRMELHAGRQVGNLLAVLAVFGVPALADSGKPADCSKRE